MSEDQVGAKPRRHAPNTSGNTHLITHQFPAWIEANGPADDVVISTRARLARNLKGIPFPNRAADADLKRAMDSILHALHSGEGQFGKLKTIRPNHLTEAERRALVDNRIMSRHHAQGGSYRPVVVNDSGTLSVMVNEEDHLRIQCILPGLQFAQALEAVQNVDNFLGAHMGYAHTEEYGYLTASPANVGTGLRMSALLHLAGLTYFDEVLPVLSAAVELKTSVRGLFGEGTKAYGEVFQVSNETTRGFSESEIMSRVRTLAEHLVSREREARHKLAVERQAELGKEIQEVRAQVMGAHALSVREAMEYLSILRLGSAIGLGSVTPRLFNELLVAMRLGDAAVGAENLSTDMRRARLMQEKIVEHSEAIQLTFLE